MKWYMILNWNGSEAYILDTDDLDTSEDELRLCMLEQVYGIKTGGKI